MSDTSSLRAENKPRWSDVPVSVRQALERRSLIAQNRALQQRLEDLLLQWVRLMRARYRGDRLALGGGVFMNVKANMLIGQEDWVEEMFAFPSCGDESNAVGAAYLGYLEECARRGVAGWVQPFGPAYLGPSVTDEDAEAVIRERHLEGRYKVAFHDRIEEKIAELLVSDGVVARCAGRMEFGARALGNRSILADPRLHQVAAGRRAHPGLPSGDGIPGDRPGGHGRRNFSAHRRRGDEGSGRGLFRWRSN